MKSFLFIISSEIKIIEFKSLSNELYKEKTFKKKTDTVKF